MNPAIKARFIAAVGHAQTLFGNTATIGGVDVPIVTGTVVRLGEEYGPGGINATQAIAFSYAIDGTPAPVIGQHIVFNGLTFRIETIQQNPIIWEIEAVQVIK
jgi:hypothetical protein